jgi:hypothetical protein
MARWEELYQQVCDLTAGMSAPDLDPETRKIWLLNCALSEAFWRRVREREPGFSAFNTLCRNMVAYQAESDDEIAIWDELTAPHNYPALARYIAHCEGYEYAGGVVAVARRRWEAAGRPGGPPTAT